ncbi:MAG: hypothetical protein IPH48_16110 [bacterium]|jgi:hypothetical protein|nr:hypothetical protein [bacterium]
MEGEVKLGQAFAICVFAFCAFGAAHGDVVTWTTNHQFNGSQGTAAYFDQTPIGITEVRARVTGHGGIAEVDCTESGESFTTNWCFFLNFDYGGAAFVTNANEPFDLEQVLPLGEGLDWQFVERGYAFIMVNFYIDLPLEQRLLDCHSYYWQSTNPVTIDSLTITITCDSAVATEGSTWGQVKALFR